MKVCIKKINCLSKQLVFLSNKAFDQRVNILYIRKNDWSRLHCWDKRKKRPETDLFNVHWYFFNQSFRFALALRTLAISYLRINSNIIPIMDGIDSSMRSNSAPKKPMYSSTRANTTYKMLAIFLIFLFISFPLSFSDSPVFNAYFFVRYAQWKEIMKLCI